VAGAAAQLLVGSPWPMSSGATVDPPIFDLSASGAAAHNSSLAALNVWGYEWVRKLGRGQYGTVHLVRRESTGDLTVAKLVFLDDLSDRDRALTLQEVEVLKRLQHPNVVRFHESWRHRTGGPDDSEVLVNCMEYCAGGDLRMYLETFARGGGHLPEDVVLSLFRQMLAGLHYMHSQKILHRDLKTSNVFLDGERRVVKIGDLGIARVLENTAAVALTTLGTPYYMSPEVCKAEPYRDKSDMWSLGCVLYEMCMLRHAFDSQSLLGLVYCIVSEHFEPVPAELYSARVRDIISRLLAKSADDRPSASEMLGSDVESGGPQNSAMSAESGVAPGGRDKRLLGSRAAREYESRASSGDAVLSSPAVPVAGVAALEVAPPPPPPPLCSSVLPRPPDHVGEDEGDSSARDSDDEENDEELRSPPCPFSVPGRHLPCGAREPSPPMAPSRPTPKAAGPLHGAGAPTALLPGPLPAPLPAPPQLQRPAPPPGRSLSPERRRSSGQLLDPVCSVPPLGGQLRGAAAQRVASPPEGLAAFAAAAARPLISSPTEQHSPSGRPMPWAEAAYETQVLLTRVRSTLLRRPRARGNWVQAFALHDTTGQGLLSCGECAAFLESLSLGLSRSEVWTVAKCLAGDRGQVSLGCFSEAVSHAAMVDERFGESWARGAAGTLACCALPEMPAKQMRASSLSATDHQRLLSWLPKALDGEIDWAAMERWRG